jgi:hypothetical protein
MSQSLPEYRGDPPVCVAIVICNEVIEDVRTRNKTLVSLFNAIHVETLPANHPRCFLMASLTNLKGQIPLTFVIRTPSDKELMKMEGAIGSDDPLQVLDVVVEVRGLPLEETGVYMVDVFAGRTHLGNRRFQVFLGTPTEGNPEAHD